MVYQLFDASHPVDDMKHIITNQQLQDILKSTTNLKDYSKDVESKLFEVERGTIGDCNVVFLFYSFCRS